MVRFILVPLHHYYYSIHNIIIIYDMYMQWNPLNQTPLGPRVRILGVVGFIRARIRCHLGSLGSFPCVLGVAIHSCAFRGSRFAWFIQALPGGRWGRSGSLDSFIRGLWVVLLIWLRSGAPWWSLGSLGRALRVDGFIPARPVGRWVHSGALWVSSVSLEFIRARFWGRRVHLAYLGAFRRTFGVVLFIRALAWDRRVHSGSFVGVVGFIRVRCVHLRASWGVVGFIRICCVHSCLPWLSLG